MNSEEDVLQEHLMHHRQYGRSSYLQPPKRKKKREGRLVRFFKVRCMGCRDGGYVCDVAFAETEEGILGDYRRPAREGCESMGVRYCLAEQVVCIDFRDVRLEELSVNCVLDIGYNGSCTFRIQCYK